VNDDAKKLSFELGQYSRDGLNLNTAFDAKHCLMYLSMYFPRWVKAGNRSANF